MARRLVFLDTETTGLSPNKGDRIIEIGCLEVFDRKITDKKFHVYLNPERKNSERSIEITGLKDDFLKNQKKFADIVEDFIQFMKSEPAEIVIHNAKFDRGFLDAELARIDPDLKLSQLGQITCTLEMARLKRPGQKNNLDALCKAYKIDNQHRQYHGALLDADLTARVYLAMTAGQVGLPMFGSDFSQTSSGGGILELSEQPNFGEPIIIRATAQENQQHNTWHECENKK